MIKDTLEFFRKKTIENVGDFILKIGKETTRKDVLDSAEKAFLTSHISYLDEKIKEIDNLIEKDEHIYCDKYYVRTSTDTIRCCLYQEVYVHTLELIKSSLQKEKSQAEELLKGL